MNHDKILRKVKSELLEISGSIKEPLTIGKLNYLIGYLDGITRVEPEEEQEDDEPNFSKKRI